MMKTNLYRFAPTLVSLMLVAGPAHSDDRDEVVYDAYMDFASLVQGGSVTPNWMSDGRSFWIAEGGPQDRKILSINPANNTTEPMFDVARLRSALTEALGYEPAGQGVPFSQLAFVPIHLGFWQYGFNTTYPLTWSSTC